MESEEELQENRFGYLLQPIRDLAENWNVDIASELAKYLEELANLMVDFQGKRMNFTEAALLIQGSAAVYSKKVEYLHGLVLQTLELLADRRKDKANKPTDEGGLDEDNQEDDVDESDWKVEYDLIDVVVDEGDDIYMDMQEDNRRYINICNGDGVDSTILPAMPMSLIPLEEWEKSDVVIRNSNGEVVGKREDFRVNTCFVHSSGALLLDLENAQYIDQVDAVEQRRLFSAHTNVFGLSNSQQPISQNTRDIVGPPPAPSPQSGDRPPSILNMSPGIMEGSACEDMIVGDEHNDENTLMPFNNDKNGVWSVEGMRDGAMTMLRPSEGMAVRSSSVALRDGQQIGCSGRLTERVVNQSAVDPWGEIDPFCVMVSNQRRPIRIAKCTRTAEQVKRINNRKWDKLHKNAVLNPEPEVRAGYPREWLTEFITRNFYSADKELPKSKLKIPTNPSLNDICLRAYKRRQEVRKGWKNFAAGAGDADSEEEDNPYDSVSLEGEGEEEEGEGDGVQPIGDECNVPDIHIEDMDFAPPEQMVQARKEACLHKMMQQEELSPQKISEMTYEELVVYFVEKYLSSAQDFVITSELTRRVEEWEWRVKPVLEEEDLRRQFDIHAYGSEFLNKFEGVGERKSFAALLGKVHHFDVSRYFLSSLMMANTSNVEIGHSELKSQLVQGEHKMDKMTLTLLSTHRHHEQFQ